MDVNHFDTAITRHLDRQSRRWQPQVAVHAPGFGIDYHYGATDLPFHAASVGKLVTAAMTIQLIEQGKLELDSRVASLLDPRLLRGIFRDENLYDVTIEHLLLHTSGANDYFLGQAQGPNISELAVANPDQQWSPLDLLSHARCCQRPVSAPGKRFFYSDTGFIVLGLILESSTATDFHDLVHKRIFEPLGMRRSFMPGRTRPTTGSGRIAPLYLGKTRIDAAPVLSVDWAGGGIAATPGDFLTLIKALRTGVLVSETSWSWMTKPRHTFRSGLQYGAGTMTVKFEGLVPWLWCWPRLVGHLGISAAHLWYDPVHDADVVVNFGSTRAMRPSFRTLVEIERLIRVQDGAT